MDPAFEARLKAIFDEFDDDGGGEIDTEELGQVMEKLGQHCTEAELHVRLLSASVLPLHPRPLTPSPRPPRPIAAPRLSAPRASRWLIASSAQDMVNEVDLDGNGTIEFDEFLQMMTSTQDNSTSFENEIIGAFATFDSDDSGYVSEEQLKKVVTNLGERLEDDEVAAVIACCKEKGWVDERGRISYRDFVLNEMQDTEGVD